MVQVFECHRGVRAVGPGGPIWGVALHPMARFARDIATGESGEASRLA